MISITIEQEQLQDPQVLHATLELLALLAKNEMVKHGTVKNEIGQQIKESHLHTHSYTLSNISPHHLSSSHIVQASTSSHTHYYCLPIDQVQDWITKLSPLQARFVTMLQQRTRMTLDEIIEDVPLQLDDQKNKIKQVNGFIGVIARWSSKYYQGLGKFRVPWECKNQTYYWREDLLGPESDVSSPTDDPS